MKLIFESKSKQVKKAEKEAKHWEKLYELECNYSKLLDKRIKEFEHETKELRELLNAQNYENSRQIA